MNTLVEKRRLERNASAEGLPRKTDGLGGADGGVRTVAVAVAAASIGSYGESDEGCWMNEWRKAWCNRNGEDEAWSDPTYLWWRRRDWMETKREKRTLERLKCQGVRACLSLLIFYFYKIKLFFYIINYLIQFIA